MIPFSSFKSSKSFEETTSPEGRDTRSEVLKPYFHLKTPGHRDFFGSAVGAKQFAATHPKEEGWNHRLEWCLNKLYGGNGLFSLCFGDDWMQVGNTMLDSTCWRAFNGTPDLVCMKKADASVVVVQRAEGEYEPDGIIECKETEGGGGGEGQLFAAMMVLSASVVLRRLVKGEDVPEETVSMKGLLLHRKNNSTICQLDIKLWRPEYPKWTCQFRREGASSEYDLLRTLEEVWPLPTAGDALATDSR